MTDGRTLQPSFRIRPTRNIGGRGAIERYDALIAKQGGFQFLLGQREAVAHTMRRRRGLAAAQQAAGELGLPAFATLAD